LIYNKSLKMKSILIKILENTYQDYDRI